LPNYIKSGPFINSITPPGISSAFLNALENVLSQPSGGTETGKYVLEGSVYTSSTLLSQYMPSISRTAVPVSVTVDEADVAHNGCNAIASQRLTANGVQLWASAAAASVDARVGGNLTFNY
jgi:hypothetical protein